MSNNEHYGRIVAFRPISRSLGARLHADNGCIYFDRDEIDANALHDLADLIVDNSPSRFLRSQGKYLRVVPRCKTQTALRKFGVATPCI